MPIEIRELIIKTEIASVNSQQQGLQEQDLGLLKKQLLEECKRMVMENTRKDKR